MVRVGVKVEVGGGVKFAVLSVGLRVVVVVVEVGVVVVIGVVGGVWDRGSIGVGVVVRFVIWGWGWTLS